MKTKTLINAAMMMAIYLVFLILYNMGIFSFLTSIMLPLPLIIFSVMSKKVSEVMLLFLGCLLGSYAVASVFGIMATLIFGLSGAILGISIIYQRPYWQRLLNASLVHVIGMPLLTRLISGVDMGASLAAMVNESMEMAHTIMPTADLTVISQTFDQVISQLLPTILLIAGLVTVFLSDRLATFVMKRLQLETAAPFTWQSFQLGTLLAVIYMGAQLLQLWLDFPLLNTILLNFILLFTLLFAIQGILVINMFFQSRAMSKMGIFAGVILFVSGLSMVLAMLGVMDALYNYRKRFFLKSGL